MPGVESSQDPMLARVDASLPTGTANSGAGVGGGSVSSQGEPVLEPWIEPVIEPTFKVSVPWIGGEATDEGPTRPKPKTKEEFRMRQEEEAREAEEAIGEIDVKRYITKITFRYCYCSLVVVYLAEASLPNTLERPILGDHRPSATSPSALLCPPLPSPALPCPPLRGVWGQCARVSSRP